MPYMDFQSKIRNFLASSKQRVDAFARPVQQTVSQVNNQIPAGFKNFLTSYADTYQKVSPYVPFAPHFATPQQVTNTLNTTVKPVLSTIQQDIKPLVNYVAPQGGYTQNDTPQLLQAAQATPKVAFDLFGLSRLTPGILGGSALISGGVNTLLDRSNKSAGQKFQEGAAGGLKTAPSIAAVGAFTNPLIAQGAQKLTGLINNPLGKQAVSRLATGVGNIPEGFLMNQSLGQGYNPAQAATDFATGVVTGGGPKLPVGQNIAKKVHPEDAGIIDRINTLLHDKTRKPESYTQNELANVFKYLDSLAEHHLTKTEIQNAINNVDELSKNKQLQQAKNLTKLLLKRAGDTNPDYRYASKIPGMGMVENNLTPDQQAAKAKLPNILFEDPQRVNPTANDTVSAPFNPDQYVKEQVNKQDAAAGSRTTGGIKATASNFLNEIKKKIVDSTAPIEDAVNLAEKQGKYKILPKQDIRLQIDRVLRSQSLASQFATDNGLVDAIKKAPDLNMLNQYMIAKQAASVAAQGLKTGRDAVKDQQLIQALGPQYEQIAQQVNQYSRKLLQYSVDNGLIDKSLADELVKKYPNYVPLQRIFDELEQGGSPGGLSGQIASISSQSVVKKLKGSDREIANPIESLLLKTQDAFNQGERNKAAGQLASYKDLPGFKDLIQEVSDTTNSPHTFSFLDNGKKRVFRTTPEIAEAAKHLNVEHMNILGKVLSYPTRLLQVGATGLNIPFVVTNVLKDQVTSFINSDKAASTSLLNPVNFMRSLFSAVKHDGLYDEVVRNAAGGTSFDIARDAPKLTVEKIRSQRNLGTKIAYTVRHPTELLRAVEDIIGRSEELGRIQNYRGMKQGLLNQGRTLQDAELLGAQAARNNTANFARKGQWGSVLNGAIPFFNAGIQGARQLDDSFKRKPVATAAKVATTIFLPMAYATFWNLSDPQRKAAYEDIPSYEKENNLILIPPNPTQDASGRWNVIKIPVPPGLSNLASMVRRPIEATHGLDPVSFGDIANNLFTAGTSIDVSSPNKLLSSVTPQALKVPIEGFTNTNLFTGQKIVPDSMKNLPPEFQVKDNTSGTARILGNKLGMSPLMVENATRTAAGGLGSQLLNTSDTVLNKAGVIPAEQVGGETITGNIERRFGKAAGGVKQSEDYNLQNTQTKIRSIESGIVNGAIPEAEGNAAIAKLNNQLNSKLSGLLTGGQTAEDYLYRKNLESKVTNAEDPIEKYKAQVALAKYNKEVADGKNPIKSRFDTELSQLRSTYFSLQKDTSISSADKQALLSEVDKQYRALQAKAANKGVQLESYTVKKTGGRRGKRSISPFGKTSKGSRKTLTLKAPKAKKPRVKGTKLKKVKLKGLKLKA